MTVDYLSTFFTKEGLDLSGLINTDFFQPIRILFQNKHYVSAAKLLFVAIDSIGHIEYGDIKENKFIKWLTTYADLSEIDITAEELWEHRNSLLHMSNLDSRKVITGKVRRIFMYLGELPDNYKILNETAGYYSLRTLIQTFAHACDKWLNTYNEDKNKIRSFIERYDLITSDTRMLEVEIPEYL